ncbi:hypothetical protein DsansV1_C14g0128921 [Dioscorea sansibarensis]
MRNHFHSPRYPVSFQMLLSYKFSSHKIHLTLIRITFFAESIYTSNTLQGCVIYRYIWYSVDKLIRMSQIKKLHSHDPIVLCSIYCELRWSQRSRRLSSSFIVDNHQK